eukprot:SAG22_NODE_595_length_8730_cov_4.200672_9_plen_41_part_00
MKFTAAAALLLLPPAAALDNGLALTPPCVRHAAIAVDCQF